MVHNSVHNLCESLVENIGGVAGATPHKAAVATPVITLTGNSVTITCAATGATIYYTLDGSTPTSGSTQYSAAFTLDSSCTIKAIAIKGSKSSDVAEESYVKPITYLTQWKIVGNSEVHTDPYLTQWKISGNSVVDNNTILSCGDLGQDGKYHVKISNGVDIYDIALDEPLRKVNDVADKIEFANGSAVLTRNLAKAILSDLQWSKSIISSERCFYRTNSLTPDKSIKPIKPAIDGNTLANVLCSIYDTIPAYNAYIGTQTGIGVERTRGMIYIYDANYNQEGDSTAFLAHINGVELIYELATPTTETIQVPQIAEAESYTCEISQGAKAVEWSDFETE